MNAESQIAAEHDVEPFMPGLFEADGASGAGVLLASRCEKCGRHFFPTRAVCSACGPEGHMESVKLRGDGVIYSSTVSHVPSPTGLKPPYAYGYVDLKDADLRVFALFTGAEPDRFEPGAEVCMIVEPLRKNADGTSVVAHKFMLSSTGGQA